MVYHSGMRSLRHVDLLLQLRIIRAVGIRFVCGFGLLGAFHIIKSRIAKRDDVFMSVPIYRYDNILCSCILCGLHSYNTISRGHPIRLPESIIESAYSIMTSALQSPLQTTLSGHSLQSSSAFDASPSEYRGAMQSIHPPVLSWTVQSARAPQ